MLQVMGLSKWSRVKLTSQSERSINVLFKLSAMSEPFCYRIIPVFGTEEALVEPMLLALDTTEPFLAVSAKKPIEQDSEIFYFKTRNRLTSTCLR